jgi:hypothetical protein
MYNRRLHEFVRSLGEDTLLTSVCTGSWVYARMGLLDGLSATNRKEPDKVESGASGKVPIDRLAEIAPACRISRTRVVGAGRIVTAGGISSGMEMEFHLLRRAGYGEEFIMDVARVMEYAPRTTSTARISRRCKIASARWARIPTAWLGGGGRVLWPAPASSRLRQVRSRSATSSRHPARSGSAGTKLLNVAARPSRSSSPRVRPRCSVQITAGFSRAGSR